MDWWRNRTAEADASLLQETCIFLLNNFSTFMKKHMTKFWSCGRWGQISEFYIETTEFLTALWISLPKSASLNVFFFFTEGCGQSSLETISTLSRCAMCNFTFFVRIIEFDICNHHPFHEWMSAVWHRGDTGAVSGWLAQPAQLEKIGLGLSGCTAHPAGRTLWDISWCVEQSRQTTLFSVCCRPPADIC